MDTQRRYDIDWLRVIAIGLLLIYHIAIVFQPWAMFLAFIKSDKAIESLWKPMTLLNVWRIPFLFYVSGMGVYFAIRRRNWKQLLLERSKRILIPFLFGMIAIVPLHFLLFQKHVGLPLSYVAHPAHLWFLGNIFLYVLILFPLFFYLKKTEGSSFQKGLERYMSHIFGPLSISALFILETTLVKPQVFEMYAMTWHGFFLGFLAFFFGFILVYSGKNFWQTVLKYRWIYLVLALGFYLIRWTVYDLASPGYLMAIESNCWIFSVFGFGFKYLNKPSKALNYLSQAAYPVYIIHMLVLYAGAMLILPLPIPVILKFLLLVVFTGIGCLGMYEIFIKRMKLLRPFFGLKGNLLSKRNPKLGEDKMKSLLYPSNVSIKNTHTSDSI
ncbi:acyltransferase family protein [Algoriphagus machipongonensis]|uniref:Membrane protein n=1 Tax=Algoriphagus machipongonensis TaxID=388413 RepID=A3HW27_9BACT|nr:acyltransferase family protein [Algoriphagus machipongonensis]EAZ82349.1 membrane protein [Algoriphagus machipongonensis]